LATRAICHLRCLLISLSVMHLDVRPLTRARQGATLGAMPKKHPPKTLLMEDEALDNARDADTKRAKRKPPGHPQLYVQAPLPDWMRDRSLLPMHPPTRTGRP
jgi:hypothetical protein